jgi:uncharacterized membrane-anchored protein YjiN (DUF445 family)
MKMSLQKMRWIASGALIFCFVGMICCRLGEAHWHWLAWPLAFFEAATVGALADWFAVVALFRHPLGIPIPHTAILPNNKARVAESLATFLEEGFLTEEQLGPRIRQIDFAGMISRWLSANAESLGSRVGKFAPLLLERIPSEQITSLLTQRARHVILTTNAAPLLAGGLQTLTGSGRDREIFNSVVISFRDLIAENRETIQTKISEEVPISSDLLNAIPFLKNAAGPALDHFRNQIAAAVANRTIEKIHTALNEACSNQDHPLWISFQTRLNQLITDVESSPELAAKIRTMQEALANSPVVDVFSRKAWEELADFLKHDLAAADSVILQKISEALLSASRELTENTPLREGTNTFLAEQVLASALAAKPHIREIVTSTINVWDAAEMTDKLEATVGTDLQFIRLNGTIVGGLIGIAIHALFVFLLK